MVAEITAQPDAPPVEAVVEQSPVSPAAVAESTPPAAAAPPVEATKPPVAATQPAPVAPVAAAPPAPTVPPEVQEYIKRLEQTTQTQQIQEDARVLQEAVTQYAQLLEREQGLTPEQAKYIADREGNRLHQQYQAERTRQGQFIAALEIGKEHGVDPRILMNLATPDAMRAAAQAATGQNRLAAENAALKAEIERLKKAAVPAQSFASGAVGGDGGKITADNIDAKYLENPERYGAVYKKFLATGQIPG